MRIQLTCVLICLGIHSSSVGDDVLKLQRSRQPKVHSLQLEWTQETSFVNDQGDSLVPGEVDAATGKFVYDSTEQPQWRLELETPLLTSNGLQKSKRVSILDKNGELTDFFPVSKGHPRSAVFIARQQSQLNQQIKLTPITMLYLPWREDWNPKYVGQETIDGILCRRYKFESSKEPRLEELWVMADTPGFRPVRFASFHENGNVHYDFHFSTEVGDQGVTRLKGWRSDLPALSDLTVRQRQIVKITNWKVNKPVDARTFHRPPFPHGTTVQDSLRGKNYVLRRTADGGGIQDVSAYYDAQFVLEPDPTRPAN